MRDAVEAETLAEVMTERKAAKAAVRAAAGWVEAEARAGVTAAREATKAMVRGAASGFEAEAREGSRRCESTESHPPLGRGTRWRAN